MKFLSDVLTLNYDVMLETTMTENTPMELQKYWKLTLDRNQGRRPRKVIIRFTTEKPFTVTKEWYNEVKELLVESTSS